MSRSPSPTARRLGIAPEDASVTVPATVVNSSESGGVHRQGSRPRVRAESGPSTETTSMPITIPPGLRAARHRGAPGVGHVRSTTTDSSGRSFLNFGATAWNAGPGILMVEGFRDPALHDDGRLPVLLRRRRGRRQGRRWRTRVRRPRLVMTTGTSATSRRTRCSTRTRSRCVDSGKEAFCLAPTDPIDLTVDGADWRPWLTNLSTACGEEGSLWIREVLQTGWGDTYAQYRPGQSFEVTDLPNGKYFVQVLANPGRRAARELDRTTTSRLREIYLRGKPG